ncbi:MAG: multidrug effflux MFS transporter [Succinivibrio sp.]
MQKTSTKILYYFTLGMLCAFAPMCTDLYLPTLPEIMNFYQTKAALVQVSLTASFMGLAIGQIFIGPLSDVYGRIPPLLISLVIFTISSIVCAYSPTVEFFIAARFIQGMAAAGGVVLTRSIACDLFKGAELTAFMSFLMGINSIAPIAAPLIGSVIVTFAPWYFIFILLGLWGVMLFVLTKLTVKETLVKEHRAKSITDTLRLMKDDLLNLKFMLFCLSFAFIMGGFFSYLSASPFVFQVIYGYTENEFALTFAFISICVLIFSLLSGRLAVRVDNHLIVKVAHVLLLISGLLSLVTAFVVPESSLFIMLFLAVFCSMMGFAMSPGFAIVMEAKRGGAGSASGIFGVMYFMVGSLISPFVGILGENSMIPLGCNLLICAILSVVLFKIAKRI